MLVTDGITEASEGTEELGDAGLIAGLRDLREVAAAEAAPRILELARRFAVDELADDATVMVVDVSPAASPRP